MGTGHPPPHSNHQCRQALVCKRQPTGQIQPPPVSAQVFLRTHSSNTPPVAASQWRRRAAWLFQHEHHRAAISHTPALPGEGRPAPLGGGCRRNSGRPVGARPAPAHCGTPGSPTHGTDPCTNTRVPARPQNNPFWLVLSREEVPLLRQILSPWKGSNFCFKLVTKYNKFVTKEEEVPKKPWKFLAIVSQD